MLITKIGGIRTGLMLAGLTCLMPYVEAQSQYNITDLGTLGGGYSTATDINNLGQVVGYSHKQIVRFRPFRTAPNSPINPATDELGSNIGGYGFFGPSAINDSGQVAGIYAFSRAFAFRTEPNSATVLTMGPFGCCSSAAYGINNSGQVVGQSDRSTVWETFPAHAFRTAPNSSLRTATDDLGALTGTSASAAYAINSSGQVVGSSYSTSYSFSQAFRTAPDKAINPATDDLGTLGGTFVVAYGINDSGQAVGRSTLAGNAAYHAFRTAPNAVINPATDDLGTLGGALSEARHINKTGQVVGWASTAGNAATRPFLYTGGVMYDLTTLIPVVSGWSGLSAAAINDAGQIVGDGVHNGETHAFRMDPLPRSAVAIRIKGGAQRPATINSDSNGRIQVTILSSAAFNAPVMLDRTSLTFGRTGDEHSLEACLGAESAKGNGLYDLVCQFSTAVAGFQPGDTAGILKGKTATGTPIMGTDEIRVEK